MPDVLAFLHVCDATLPLRDAAAGSTPWAVGPLEIEVWLARCWATPGRQVWPYIGSCRTSGLDAGAGFVVALVPSAVVSVAAAVGDDAGGDDAAARGLEKPRLLDGRLPRYLHK